jgi:hypothetical protein
MFERGDPWLNARPPGLYAPKPALLFARSALSTQRASSRQNYCLTPDNGAESLADAASTTLDRAMH